MNLDFFSILYTLIIQPLAFVFEVIFSVANKLTYHPGLSIIVLSLIMNFLVLPLYKRADDMQEKQRLKEESLKKGIDHIKKSFSGDERMMILQTYYRQNNYKPTDALNGSISLLLEVPFFLAAYDFLSHLALLEGVSLGPIANLGQPDAMFVIGGLTINVLPVLMTVVNIISSAIYLKGFPLKTKIQLYAMAMFFLVFLYDSPSGLVFYWTLNNVFSLVKNIFYKLKEPGKVLRNMASILGLIIICFVLFIYKADPRREFVLMVVGLGLELPLILSKMKWKQKENSKKKYVSKYSLVFLAGLLISIVIGLYIPSSVISSSPEEFMSFIYFHNPNNYLVYTLSMAIGFFMVWVGVFYWVSNEQFKVVIERLLIVASFIFIVNFMFFGTNLGTLLPNLAYQTPMRFTMSELLLNIVAILAICLAMIIIFIKFQKHIPSLLCITILAFGILSGFNISTISKSATDFESRIDEITAQGPHFNLSKDGQNVMVIILDRAIGSYVPFMMKEDPTLLEKFDGFTYYSNVVSYGAATNVAIPSVFGGYEYTPIKLNQRDSELLVDKHNESLKVLPVLYSNHNYDVTVFDPSYANYTWVPDVSIYNEYEDINAYVTEGRFNSVDMERGNINANYRNFFCFSLMKSLPLCTQSFVYDYGYYHKLNSTLDIAAFHGQKTDGTTVSEGISSAFMESYYVLENMTELTNIQDNQTNNFFLMTNCTTHEPNILQTPEYRPSMNVDNTQYFESIKDIYTIDDVTLKMDTVMQVSHYHVNMAAFQRLGEWFDYLRENDVYDNTKIILVSDHGRDVKQIDQLHHDKNDVHTDVELYYPLMMVKDFNSKGFKTSTEFMTNADVPAIAVNGTIENPINPFTGKVIDSTAKYEEPVYIARAAEYNTNINNGYTLLPSKWAMVKDDIWVQSNWTFYDEKTVNPPK